MGQPSSCVWIVHGKSGRVYLGVVEAQNAAEGAFQLVLHHFDQVGVCGAEAVDENDGVGDGGVGLDVVEPGKDAIVLTAGGITRSGAEEAVNDGAIGVKNNGEWIVGRRWRDVGRRGEYLVPRDDGGSADVFVQRSRR